MTASYGKESDSAWETVVKGSEVFKIEYAFRDAEPGSKRRYYSAMVSDIDLEVQAKLGFPDFELYSGMLHVIRSVAKKRAIAPVTCVRVNGYLAKFVDHGDTVTVSL